MIDIRFSIARTAGAALLAGLVYSPLLHAGQGGRLSDWLLRNTATGGYPLGLMWKVEEEQSAQAVLRQRLLQELERSKSTGMEVLRSWLLSLPLTGRVRVPKADAEWLQAHPAHDPVLAESHRVVLPARPGSVTVLRSDGTRCQAPHRSGNHAPEYLHRCATGGDIDWVWIVQPDGEVQKRGVAAWNAQQQDEPAPGAWLWAPKRSDEWSAEFSALLAEFLATQGAAPDDASLVQAEMSADSERTIWRAPVVTSNDWGGAGLLQTPTARMRSEGYASFSHSRIFPYWRYNVALQPFDWLEGGFRYTNVENRKYGPVSGGAQSYKDKSIDLKLRIAEESAWFPQIAVGLRDIAGTGYFSGEYVVANKRIGNFDWSLGLGWGNVGGRQNLNNPLMLIGGSWGSRGTERGDSGSFGYKNYFRGATALFGGVQYHTSWDSLLLKLELDGNNYQHEFAAYNYLANNQPQSTPWNVGLVYRVSPEVELTAAYERGNSFSVSLVFQTELARLQTPKLSDPPPVTFAPLAPRAIPQWTALAQAIEGQSDWQVGAIRQSGSELHIEFENAGAFYWRARVERVAAVLHSQAPAGIERFILVYRVNGTEMATHVIDRTRWVRQHNQLLSIHERVDAVGALPAPTTKAAVEPGYRGEYPVFEVAPGMDLKYVLGGPDAFVLYQLAAAGDVKWHLAESIWLQGTAKLGLVDNFNLFKYTAPSKLPRVRTYMREYMTTSAVTMPNLQLTHTGRLGANQHYSLYAGYLEEMFAGYGAEWLYRPFESQVAVGIDVNHVRQRDFRQDLALRNYAVDTGHLTLYWDTGWNDVHAKLSAGRYLAGDKGVTVDLAREFRNGVRMGAFFTKTNVSAEQFGEGSFDKGIYLSIPLDAMLTRSTAPILHFLWKPLTRDGGAQLGRAVTLYDTTALLSGRTLRYRPPAQQ